MQYGVERSFFRWRNVETEKKTFELIYVDEKMCGSEENRKRWGGVVSSASLFNLAVVNSFYIGTFLKMKNARPHYKCSFACTLYRHTECICEYEFIGCASNIG